MSKKYAIQSFGCRVNLTEADSYREILNEAGYCEVPFGEPADVVIVHTCTVTNMADSKSRQAMHKARRDNPEAILVVSGCYAQVSEHDIAAEEKPDILIGTKKRHELLKLLQELEVDSDSQQIDVVEDILKERTYEDLPTSHTGRTRAFIKIEEGCQQFCTYCIIPFARGPVRSRNPQDVIASVRHLVNEGLREIVFTGIHTGAYGQDIEGYDLGRLLREVIPSGIERIRLGSLDPKEFTDSLKNVLFSGAPILNHFHISLQSGDDTVLNRMKRGYTAQEYRKLIYSIRENIDNVSITTDVMVGFPGETEEQHNTSLEFVKEMGFSDIHIFKYSPRNNTKAASFPDQIKDAVKERRMQEMLSLKKQLNRDFFDSQMGIRTKVLVEKVNVENNQIVFAGYGENYQWIRCEDENNGQWNTVGKNSVIEVEVKDYDQHGLIAKLLERS
ncbi:tRNA (N(6)-L-threonylcarbamoyladenosine(37)-C(2))-methylthiotransferase MtaB [Clostridia bacterium]|nr:tRNA (N(6)-L-threonylcarbamoyladenosine(37)-C(2))-methylthiotransferase MtaB [Clostridia bacterium]